MNTRAIAAAGAVVFGIAIQSHVAGFPFDNPATFALAVGGTAFLLPGIVVPLAERLVHIDPFGAGHYWLTLFFMVIVAGWFWWWIGPRAQRAAGIFDAFRAHSGMRTRIVQKIADAYSSFERRRFGREKTGGWA